jgi:hypothetical protein
MTSKDFKNAEKIKQIRRISWDNEQGIRRWLLCVDYKPTGSKHTGITRRYTWSDKIPFSACAFLENARLAWSYEFEQGTTTECYTI